MLRTPKRAVVYHVSRPQVSQLLEAALDLLKDNVGMLLHLRETDWGLEQLQKSGRIASKSRATT